MSEESEAEKIKLEDDLKKVLRQLRLVLRIYDPDKYEVDILVVNKDDWIKKIEDCHVNVLEVLFHIQGVKLLPAADLKNLTESIDDIDKEVVDYITRFTKKTINHLHSTADVETLVHDDLRPESAKIADINSDVVAEDASNEEAGLCQPDTQKIELVTSNVTEVSSSALVVAAVDKNKLMLKETSIKENLVVPVKDLFRRPVYVNYFERGKIKYDVRATDGRDGKGILITKGRCCQSYFVVMCNSGAGDRCIDVPLHDMEPNSIHFLMGFLPRLSRLPTLSMTSSSMSSPALRPTWTLYLMLMIPLML